MKVASVFSLLILFCFSFFFLCIFFLTSGLVYLSILIMVHFLTNRATFFIFLLFPLRGFCLLCREDSFGTAIKKIQGSPGFFPSSGNKIPLSVQMEKRIFFWEENSPTWPLITFPAITCLSHVSRHVPLRLMTSNNLREMNTCAKKQPPF